tara:strand:- start:136 stop:336 length:201 start_codon:yes stop_codon:yes gene_type:complete
MVNEADPRSVAAALLGKLGGQSRSEAKRAASAHNGRISAVRKHPRCENCEEKKRTCYHRVKKEVTK